MHIVAGNIFSVTYVNGEMDAPVAQSSPRIPSVPEIRTVALSALLPAPYNPRRISPAALRALEQSLQRFGYVEPIIWNQRSGFVIGGHQRLKILRREKRREVPVVVVDLDRVDERALNVALNSDTLRGEFTVELEALLDEIATSRAALYADLRLDELRANVEAARPSMGDVDDIPAPPNVLRTKPGDAWVLGRHRLVCGDSSDAGVWKALLGVASANLVVTSPPYASQREYDPTSGFLPIPADRYVRWFSTIVENVKRHLADDGSFCLNLKENCEAGQRVLYVKELVLHLCRECGWRFIDEFCWTHGATPKAPAGRFKNGFEPIFHLARNANVKFRPRAVRHDSRSIPDWGGLHPSQQDGRAMQKRRAHDEVCASAVTAGLAYPSNVIDFVGKNREAVDHGAVFPVGLPEFFIRAFTDPGDIVVDPFAGAGTTLIAAHVNNRAACVIELSPAYCDVIVERWQRLTGETARRDG